MSKNLLLIGILICGVWLASQQRGWLGGWGNDASITDTGRLAQPGDGKNATWKGTYIKCSDQARDITLSCTGTIVRARQTPQGAPQPRPSTLQLSRDGRFSGHQLDWHCRDLAIALGRPSDREGLLCTQEEAEAQARRNPRRHLEVETGTPNAQGLILAIDNRWFRADGHRVDPTTGWRFSNHPGGRQSQFGQLHATREWQSYALYLACANKMQRENKPFDRDNPPCTQEEALREIERNPARYRNYRTQWDKSKEKLNYLEEDWREKR